MRNYVYSLFGNTHRYTFARPVREYVYSHGGYRGCARTHGCVAWLEQLALVAPALWAVFA